MNLRGLTESATVLSYPVYLFIIGLIVLIIVGTYRVAIGDVQPHMHSTVGTAVPGVTLFLLKAFSSGASSLTGVEAISNAVTNFGILLEKCSQNSSNYGDYSSSFTVRIMGALLRLWCNASNRNYCVISTGLKIFGNNVAFYFVQQQQ